MIGEQTFDISIYSRPADELETYYGLPRDVRFCTKCVRLIPDCHSAS